MKKILMIGTGGTIASVNKGDGLTPDISGNELLKDTPDIFKLCDVDCIQPISLDSTNMRPGHWLLLANAIAENYDKYDGFVITHGTDTMAYTAAALSYLIQNSPKPIVLTGAQRAAGETGSDAESNLMDAFTVACDDETSGVKIAFSGALICGTRARKNFSKSFAAFGSVNFPEMGRINNGSIIRFVPDSITGPVKFYDSLNPNVGVVKFVPGMRRDVLEYLIDKYDGLVIESFGVGGLPEYSDFFEQIKGAGEKGKLIVMTTQVPNEGSNLSIYRVGNRLKKGIKILEAYDMTTEAAFAKIQWILWQTSDFDEAMKLFYKEIDHDILTQTNFGD